MERNFEHDGHLAEIAVVHIPSKIVQNQSNAMQTGLGNFKL